MPRARFVALAAALVCAACQPAGLGDRAATRTGGPGPATEPVTAPDRILAVAPSLVEILFELGLGERVVAVGDYVSWPPEAANKPRIGGLFDPHLEDIVALEPDLAILLPSEEKLAVELGRLGIEVLTVEHETLADIEASFESIARRAGVDERGRELIARWRRGLGDPSRGALSVEPDGNSTEAGLRTILVVAREPGDLASMTVVGSRTFLAELLNQTGAHNVFGDLERAYAEVGLEEVLRRAPDVVLELQPDELDMVARENLMAEWAELEFPEFQRQGSARVCVEVLTGEHVLSPGPRLMRLMAELEAAIARCKGAR